MTEIVRARTRAGSTYRFDKQSMTWEEESESERSGRIPVGKGELMMWPKIEVGSPVLIVTATSPSLGVTAILTSPVVAFAITPVTAVS